MKNAYDIVVVGSGIAGLSFALKAAAAGRSVAILTKKNRADSNTNFAQGGLAAVMAAEDNFENHVHDTLVAGDGLCNEQAVREIVRDGLYACRRLKFGTIPYNLAYRVVIHWALDQGLRAATRSDRVTR